MSTHPRPGADAGIPGRDGRLVVRNDHSELVRVGDWVRRFARERNLAREEAHGLDLSLAEALANVMNYAYCDASCHDIIVDLHAQDDQIRVRIEDDGVPFNPLELPIEPLPISLDEARSTGRGIPLIRACVSEMHYARAGNRNVLTMVLTRAISADRTRAG